MSNYPLRLEPWMAESMAIRTERYPSEYFTGAQVSIYFGDIHVDEITALDFQIQIQMRPIFRYASYTADQILEGSRMVQGSFTVGFRNEGYLFNILNNIKADTIPSVSLYDQVTADEVSRADDIDLDRLASSYERIIWGVTRFPETQDDYRKLMQGNRSRQPFFDEQNEFTITVTYGPHADTIHGMRKGIYNSNTRPNSAVRRLVGVKLAGMAQTIQDTDGVVYEVYPFVAKDVDKAPEVTYQNP